MSIFRTFLLLAACLVLAQAAIPDPCYKTFSNGKFSVTTDPGFPSPYACTPSDANVAAAETGYVLSATPAGGCAQIIAEQEVSFGYYECELVIPGIAGTITTCQAATATRANFESVYFKFIGNDTLKAYIGYYSGGRSYPTGPVELNFDATGRKHKYGFEWTSGYIRWFVDGREVSSALGGKAIPQSPNYFYASLMVENPTIPTDDTLLPTVNVDRIFTGLEGGIAVFTNISYTPALLISCDNTGILPGNNGWQAFDAGDCDTRDRYMIYDDKVAKNWSTALSTIHNNCSTSPLRTGTCAIGWYALPSNPGASLYFTSKYTIDSSLYYSLNFWINGGNEGKNGQQIGIKMLYGDSATPSTVQVKINDVLDQGVKAGEWSRASIPFSLFGINANISEAIKGFALSTISNSYGGMIGIDDVYFGYELPMCANKSKPIYADKLAKGVSDQSWGSYGIVNLLGNTNVHSGARSIQFGMFSDGGVHIHSFQISSKDYQGISLWINTKDVQGDKWTISVTSPSGDPANNNRLGLAINLYLYYGGTIPQQADQWSRIVLPFYEFGIITDSKVDGILIEKQTTDFQGTLYIDDIDYIRQEKPPKKKSSAVSLGAGFTGIFVMLAVLLL